MKIGHFNGCLNIRVLLKYLQNDIFYLEVFQFSVFFLYKFISFRVNLFWVIDLKTKRPLKLAVRPLKYISALQQSTV